MSTTYELENSKYVPTTIPDTQRVGLGAPLRWLKLGLRDFAAAPLLSLAYGLVFALAGLGLAYAATLQPKLSLTFLVGLLIIGPVLATGLYQVARQKAHDPAAPLHGHLRAVLRHKGRVAVYILTMLLLTVAWIRLSSLMVAVYYGQATPDIGVFATAMGSLAGLSIIAPVIAAAAVFAFLIFAASVVSLPMVVDGKAEMIPALLASIKTVLGQPGPMLLWAGIVTTLTLLGIATLFVGLVFIFPLLGYATWHSYQDMVKS